MFDKAVVEASEFTSKARDQVHYQILVTDTKEGDKTILDFVVPAFDAADPTFLRRRVKKDVKEKNAADVAVKLTPVGTEIDLTDDPIIAPAPPPKPTQAELDRQAFNVLLGRTVRLQQAVAAGLAAGEADLKLLQQQLNATYDVTYF